MKDEMGPEGLRTRTKRFSLAVIGLSVKLPRTEQILVMKRQLLRSATSVAAHYREGCRARSNAEFISKLEGGLQELDETGLWLELLTESHLFDSPEVRSLMGEVDELISIFVTIVRNRKRG